MRAGYKALNVYCSERYYVAYIAAEKDGKKVMLSAGDEYDMLGQGTRDESSSFKPLKLPDDVFFPQLSTQGRATWAIDEDQNLWMWG